MPISNASRNDSCAETSLPASPSLWAPLECLLQEDDAFFSEQLPEFIKTNEFGPHADCLWHPRILARVCALSDAQLTPLVLALAQPEYMGLDLLFDDRLLPRLAQIRNGHLRGTFLPYARRLPGFDARDFLREIHRVQHQQRLTGATPIVVSMETVQPQPVIWLWWPYIALGKLCMLDGDPGIGKSLLMTQLAANLSKGYPLPDHEGKPTLPTGGPHITVMLSTEDGLDDTLAPRLDAAGADRSKIKVLTGWADTNGEEQAFSFQDMPMLEQVLQTHDPRLVIIDPIQAYLGSGVDMHRANETRPLLEKLRSLAETYHCAIVCIRHPAKSNQGGKALHRGLGSVDFIGAARTGLFVEQHPADPTLAFLAQSKSNIGPLGRTLLFTKANGEFAWCGRSRLSAEMLGGGGRGPDPHAFLEAMCWLEQRLDGGLPVASMTLREEADEEGISFPTLRRAKKALGVRSIRREESWDWALPDWSGAPCRGALSQLLGHESLEHLQACQAVSMPHMHEVPFEDPRGNPGEYASKDHDTGAQQGIERQEETLETHAEDLGDDSLPPMVRPLPMFCPRCHRRVTWLQRQGHHVCHLCKGIYYTG